MNLGLSSYSHDLAPSDCHVLQALKQTFAAHKLRHDRKVEKRCDTMANNKGEGLISTEYINPFHYKHLPNYTKVTFRNSRDTWNFALVGNGYTYFHI